ncbi:MAG TPA: hypothetical protein VNI01_10295, partial [Elusimicrobiota bacterium]|nr:hypothetical protein [Elusimicrobiota bacterium]
MRATRGRRLAELVNPGVGALCVLLSALFWLSPIMNPDLFWHLSSAKHMFATGSFPRADWLSYTRNGTPWLDFEWLCGVIWYAAFQISGIWGLWLLKAALFAAAGACVWRTAALYGLRPSWRGVCVLAWSLAPHAVKDIRCDNFSILGICALMWFLERRRLAWAKGAAPRPTPRSRAAFFAAFAAWTNLHPGFFIAYFLIGIYALEELRTRRSWALFELGLWAAAGTLVNPYGLGTYRVAWEHARDMKLISRNIVEWEPVDFADRINDPFWALLALTFASFLARLRGIGRSLPVEHLVGAGLLGWSALEHQRNMPYFTAVAVPALACHLSQLAWTDAAAWKDVLLAGAIVPFFHSWVPTDYLKALQGKP